MNVVLEPSEAQAQKFPLMISESQIVSWLFVFYFNQNISDSFLASLVSNYFNSWKEIALNSKVYILSYSKIVLMFEVFRKVPYLNATLSLLCSINQTSGSVEYLNNNDVLVRRKDFTGIHFRVGYIPNEGFFYEDNEAC